MALAGDILCHHCINLNSLQNIKRISHDNDTNHYRRSAFCALFFINKILRKSMITLFIVAIGVFAYMCYVLIKPEKF